MRESSPVSACLAGEVPRYHARRDCYEEAKKCRIKISGDLWRRTIISWSCRITASRSSRPVNHGASAHVAESWTSRLVATNDVPLYLCARTRSPTISCCVSRPAKSCRTRTGCATRAVSIIVKSRGGDEGTVSLCVGGIGKYTENCRALSCGDRVRRDEAAANLMCRRAMTSWGYLNKLCTDGHERALSGR